MIMPRYQGVMVWLALCGLFAMVGCRKEEPPQKSQPAEVMPGPKEELPEPVDPQPEEANLELELPESPTYTYVWASDYVSKLEVDGKDYSRPRKKSRFLKVEPPKGKNSVTVVYTYWPYSYSKTVRTKVVTLEKDKRTRASLLKEDPDTPDQIFPIYVPSPPGVVSEMCELAKITKDDVVYDIGCGDGRVVITAVAKFNAKKGVGIDINPDLIAECKKNAEKEGVSKQMEFLCADALKFNSYGDATVVLLYVGEDLGAKLGPVLQKSLKPGARIVSHRFKLGDWKEDRSVPIRDSLGYGHSLLLWTIPKDAASE